MKLCPFRKANPFNPNDGNWLWVTASPYNAAGDGETDDNGPFADCIDDALTAGKGVYVPPGNYGMWGLDVPSGVTMRGAGPSSSIITSIAVLGWGSSQLNLMNSSNVSIRGLKLVGPVSDGHMYDDQGIYMGNSHNITIEDVWLDGYTYAFRADGGGSTQGNSDITITNCKTLSKTCTVLLAGISDSTSPYAMVDGLTISGCDFDSDTVPNGGDGPGPSHHFYTTSNVTNVTVSNTTFRNGCSWAVQIYPGPRLSSMTFNNVTFTNVVAGVVFEGASDIAFDGVTAASDCYIDGFPWFHSYNAPSCSNLTVANAELWDAVLGTVVTGTNVTEH